MQDAQTRFRSVIDICPEHWEARLYLAMTHIQLGDHQQGLKQMTHLKDNCPRPELKQMAEHSLKVIKPSDEQEAESLEVVWKRGPMSKAKPKQGSGRRRFLWPL